MSVIHPPDRPMLGILLMLGFCAVAPLADALAKILGETVPLLMAVFARFAVQALVLAPLVLTTGRVWRLRGRMLRLVILRTALHIAGITLMFSALKYLALADAIAIAFVMPFVLLLLGHTILGEEVGPRRLIACIVGFIGTLLVIQPSFAEVGWPALLPVGVAVVFAAFILVTRLVARDTDPIGLQAVSGIMASCVLLPVLLIFGGVDTGPAALRLVIPSGQDWALLIGVGLLGTVGHLLMTWSLRFAPSATLAPMQYLEIPFATLIGWLIWRDLPDGLAALGITVTVASGLYIVLRERQLSSASAARAVQSQP
ncbi:DMT family transporter [Seohaeicola saemankumensis]|jgi:drug/metabolite transporter (DMT)-like permease|uniref:DMT family transporter n=1 Tax=Seohaeicola TaxID=481178 RepID=UPI000AE66E72|nr:DMT family transporter [Paracoccaceae bacterium]